MSNMVINTCVYYTEAVVRKSASLLKRSLWHKRFPVNFAKFLRTHFFNRTTPVAASDDKT